VNKARKIREEKRAMTLSQKISFAQAKNLFNAEFKNCQSIKQSLVPVDGKIKQNIKLLNEKKERLEEYYKWQFIYALVRSGLYFKDYIGTEVWFPKGSKSSAPLKIDACIFDDKSWINHYIEWRKNPNNDASLDFLRHHCIGVIEFKRGKDRLETVFQTQLKAALKEPDSPFVLGIIYDKERLLIFQKKNGAISRYDESKNLTQKSKSVASLSLDMPDSYLSIPSLDELIQQVNVPAQIDRTNRNISDLDTIASRSSNQVEDAMNSVLRAMDKFGLLDQRGYEILMQCLALKVFDEKRNQKNKTTKLLFYVTDEEFSYSNIHDKEAQNYIARMKTLYSEAEEAYPNVLKDIALSWTNDNHIRTMQVIVNNFQDYSFVRSEKSDLYQLVFYNFAQPFQKGDKAQFLTPLRLIDFLVSIVNPRGNDKVCDPCVGIADFLSLAYVNSSPQLDDNNLWGVDVDENMVMLSHLNMLLNGDGNAHLLHAKDKGSILYKIRKTGDLVPLQKAIHKNGKWDEWRDGTKLMKFDVILTNPPFGRGRSYEVQNQRDRDILCLYETWNIKSDGKLDSDKSMDLGVMFLENAYRLLDENGRFGIVLSNSIVATNEWKNVMEWLIDKVRLVAIFDLPEKVFAETNINPTLLVAYKPSNEELDSLKRQNYNVFVRTIKKVGYEVITKQRNLVFKTKFKIDFDTYEIAIDENGAPIVDEDFTKTIADFREWATKQEEDLQKLFVL